MFRISLCVCAFLSLAYGVLPLAAQSAAASANAVSPPRRNLLWLRQQYVGCDPYRKSKHGVQGH
jgi:hypothetical protein